MAESLRQRIIELLVEDRRIDRKKLEEVLKSSKSDPRNLGQLVKQGLIRQQDLLSTLSKGLQIPPINLARYQIDPALSKLVPERMARQYRLVPVSKMSNCLSVAMADPLNVLALDDLTTLTSLQVTPVIASEEDVNAAIQQLYRSDAGPLQETAQPESSSEEEKSESEEEPVGGEQQEIVDLTPFGIVGKRAPVVKIVDAMILEALKARASDIHLEPEEKDVRVRYRVDGDLLEAFRFPKRLQNSITTRLRIMARLDITENRLPQDGRFRVRVENREVDFRVSSLPIGFGNKIVMRALDKSNLSVGLEKIGLLPDSLAAFQKAVSRPFGMILVTGPTGSGKSTTLYSVLAQMNEPGRNILTVEDPVEYQLDGITQVQVNPGIGLTFSNALRAFLRQAPDVVLVGEIRDGETADIAVKASLTGQIVLSTLHTNDAATSITRLVDMGVDPFLLSSSLIFVAAQRLCRQLCPQCKEEESVKPEVLKKLNLVLPQGKQLYRSQGCLSCQQTGFHGRFAILEAMLVDDPIREMIIAKRPPDLIKAYAVEHGMRTLRQEGLEHCLLGRTSVEEVLRVTSDE
ncbi:MAG: Flp pilus assembly complex ATPase component TadA [Candidatus Omnitrophica bacterium]|nr:Flp pilus assembly complex ATPase component TadA [Candidatus Omnitrophota bacterium]